MAASQSPDAIGNSLLEGLVQDHGDQEFEFELKIDNSADFDLESHGDESLADDTQDIILSEGENKLLDSMAVDTVSDMGGYEESQENFLVNDNVANEDGIELQLTSDFDPIKNDTREMPSLQDFSNLDIVPQDIDVNNMAPRPDILPDNEVVTSDTEDIKCDPPATKDTCIPKLELDKLDAIRENEMVSVDSIEIDEKPVDEAESISLVDLMKQQGDDDSSGSEFDFDLPPSAKASSTDTKGEQPVSPNKISKGPAPPPPMGSSAPPPSTGSSVLSPQTGSQALPPQTGSPGLPSSTTLIPPITSTNNPSDQVQGSEVKVDNGSKEHFTSGSYPVSFKQASLTSNITMMAKPPLDGTSSVEVRDDTKEKPNKADPPQEMDLFAHSHAQNEWDNVKTIEAGFTDPNLTKGPGGAKMTPLMSYMELEETLRPMDYSKAMQNIRQSVNRRGFSALKHILFGPPKLNRNLLKEKEFIFCVAATPLDNSIIVHTRALQTIYRCLTGSRFDCGRFGPHWEEIGFQGNDPSTDLRGTGVLGLMNLVNLLRNPRRQSLAQDIYKLSLHPTQNFPFCVMGINMSRIVLQALREDCLNKECNKRQEVLGVVNDFYTALYLELYQIWKSQGKTITDSGYVIKTLESNAKKNPQRLIKNMEEYINNKKSSVNLDNMDVGGENFLSVCDTEAGQY